MTSIRVETYGVVYEEAPTPPFWLLLCVGIGWVLLSFLLLNFTYRSVAALTILIGIVLFVAAASEIAELFVAPSWKWLHGVLGGLFLLGGIAAFAYPGQTFGTLALIFGWYLLLKGTFDVVMSLALHGVHLWWMGLIAGLIEIGVAFWAIGYVGRSAALLLLWVGIGALIRGITTIVAAFQLRHMRGARA